MILLSSVTDSSDLIDTECPNCRATVPVTCVDRVNTRDKLESLLAGTLNTVACPSCACAITSDLPVHIDLPDQPEIHHLGYAPLDLLEQDTVCEHLRADGGYQYVFYSLDELARQVHARVRLSRFQSTSQQTNQSP